MTDDAVSALFDAHYSDLLRYAARRVGTADAADIVAEAFVVVCRRAQDVPPGRQRAWLFTVAAKIIQNHERGGRRQERLVARLEDHRVAPPAEFDAVHAALAQLGHDDQEVLRLIEWDQLPVVEAAAVLGCSQSAVRVRLHRARRRFATVYERELSTEGVRHE